MKWKSCWIFWLVILFWNQAQTATTVDYGYLQLPGMAPDGLNFNIYQKTTGQEKTIVGFSLKHPMMVVSLMMRKKYSPASIYGNYGPIAIFLGENYFLTAREPQIETLWMMRTVGLGVNFKNCQGLLAYSQINLTGFKKDGQLLGKQHLSIQEHCDENVIKAGGLGFLLATEKKVESEKFFIAGKISGGCLFFDGFKYYTWEKNHQEGKEITAENIFSLAALDFAIGAKIADYWQLYLCCRSLVTQKTYNFFGIGVNYYHE